MIRKYVFQTQKVRLCKLFSSSRPLEALNEYNRGMIEQSVYTHMAIIIMKDINKTKKRWKIIDRRIR